MFRVIPKIKENGRHGGCLDTEFWKKYSMRDTHTGARTHTHTLIHTALHTREHLKSICRSKILKGLGCGSGEVCFLFTQVLDLVLSTTRIATLLLVEGAMIPCHFCDVPS